MAMSSPGAGPYAPVRTGGGAGGGGRGRAPAPPPTVFRDDASASDDDPRRPPPPRGKGGHPQGGVVAAQSLDLELEQDRSEMASRERACRRRSLASACLLLALAFGGREYYVRHGGAVVTDAPLGSSDADLSSVPNGIRGSSGDVAEVAEEVVEEIVYEAGGDVDGTVLDVTNPGDGDVEDNAGGVEIYEGDVDDEIESGELEGEFDNDMGYDEGEEEGEEGEVLDLGEEPEDEVVDLGGEIPEDAEMEELPGEEYDDMEEDVVQGDFSGDLEEEEEEEVRENSPDEEVEPVEEEPAEVVAVNSEDSEGEEEVSEGLTFETPEEEGGTDEDRDPATGTEVMPLDEEEEEEEEEEPESEPQPAAAAVDLTKEAPDYFVPFAPEEREAYKERLRDTLRQTRSSLQLSLSPHAKEHESAIQLPQRTLKLSAEAPKQFMHMHHMKTGGTSLDGLIRCSLQRQKDLNDGTSINYNSMSECGSRVKSCMNSLAKELDAQVVSNVFYRNDEQGEAQIDKKHSFDPADETLELPVEDLNVCKTSEANVMSYCASLHAVRTFGWKGVDKVTVIRDPIDRAWSMYRFTLNGCYKCMELKEVLRQIANGTFSTRRNREGDDPFVYDPNDSCAVQMIGHQSTNLLSSVELYNAANDVRFPREKEIVEEAVRNLREEFTWIGITGEIVQSIDAIRTVFPFLAENLNDAAKEAAGVMEKSGLAVRDGFSLPEGYVDKGCPFEHRNAGRDPSCGTKELDEETISLIKILSNRDVAVYKAAVERFELQNEVLAEYRDGAF